MLDFIVFILLLLGFIIGIKRGFILQTIHMIGFFVSFIVAYMYHDELAPKLILWIPYPHFGSDTTLQWFFDAVNLEAAYYRAIAFVLIFFAVKIALRIIGSMLDFIAQVPIIRTLNIWAGGALGFIEVYLFIFIILFIGALLPIESIQNALNDSILARTIVDHTPVLSKQIKSIWFDNMAI